MDPQKSAPLVDPEELISGRDWRLIALWAVALLGIFLMAGFAGVRQLQTSKAQTQAVKDRRVATGEIDGASTATTAGADSADASTDVMAGIHLRKIRGLSLKEAEWNADFEIWFSWSGDRVQPGESFDVVNGDIQQRTKVESYVRNGRKYERYRVTANMTKHIDPARFPFAEEELTIEIQDNRQEGPKVRYVADQVASGVSAEGFRQNGRITRTVLVSTIHRDNPDELSGDEQSVHSRLILIESIRPASLSLYLMMFQALFAAVAVAMIVFFVRATYDNTRFAIPLAAFFAAVANNIFVASQLPRTERITLTGMVNAISLGTIFLILVQSAISLHMAGPCNRGRLSRVFDRLSVAIILPGYITLNILLPLAAGSS